MADEPHPAATDNVNLLALRGLLTTEDGTTIYVEMNGFVTLRTTMALGPSSLR